MRLLLVFLFLLSTYAFAQKKRFFEVLLKTPFTIYPESDGPKNIDLDVVQFDSVRAVSSFLYSMSNHRYRIAKAPFTQDSIYNRICNTVANSLNKSIYSNPVVWSRKRKYIYKALTKLNSHYRFYHAYAFKVKLVDYGMGAFYYDKDDEDSELKLIYGNKSRNKEKIDRGEPLDYIQPISQKYLDKMLVKKIVQYIGRANFKLSYYDRIGVAIKLNRRSINRRAIPEAYVVVMLGGKVMQKIIL